MKKLIFIGVLLSFLHFAQAQTPIVLPVWENGAPESNGIAEAQEQTNTERPTNITEAILYVYPASHPNGIAIVCCPGGGYQHLAMAHEGTDMAGWFNELGITFAVLKYRMPNGHKNIPVSDAQKAIQVMKKHADEWQIDTCKIGIMGASAGGHLAASTACLSPDNNRPAFQILLYPVITMKENTHNGSKTNLLGTNPSNEDINYFSLEEQITKQTPPAFIALSSDDKTVPPCNSLNYAKALIDSQIKVNLHLYPEGGHGWGFRDRFKYKKMWTEELKQWIQEINK